MKEQMLGLISTAQSNKINGTELQNALELINYQVLWSLLPEINLCMC